MGERLLEVRMYTRQVGGQTELCYRGPDGEPVPFLRWDTTPGAGPAVLPLGMEPATVDIVQAGNEQLSQEPHAPPPVPTGKRAFSMRDLLRSAENEGQVAAAPSPPAAPVRLPEALPPVPVEDAYPNATRRRAAKGYVRNALIEATRLRDGELLKYEHALMVKNRNVQAMEDMQLWAAAANLSVMDLADRIIVEHDAKRRRTIHLNYLLAKAEAEINEAEGDEIDLIATDAARKIRGDDE